MPWTTARSRLHAMRLLPLLCLLACACVHSAALQLGEERFAPQSTDHPILVFDTLEDVPFPYVKLARVVASGSNDARWSRVLAALQDEARKVGADALVLGRGGEGTTDLATEGGVVMGRTLWALAIRKVAAKAGKAM